RSSMRAEKVLAEAVEYSQGGTPLILSDLALAKTRLKLLDQAMTLIEEADSLTFRTPEILTFSAQLEERRAQIYLERQQWKSGVKYLKRAYEIDPSNRRVLYMIARTYRKLNDWDNEERYLNALLKETDPNTIEGSEWAKYAKSRLLSIKEERFMQKK
ncbi:tetratricopeptide repeat protein, partial [Porphyromonas levii]